ncbi:DUF5131 family protein [Akkermansia massiliensis]
MRRGRFSDEWLHPKDRLIQSYSLFCDNGHTSHSISSCSELGLGKKEYSYKLIAEIMAKNSSIEWTHHTFNPWWGCTKVSPACANCYAETWAKRVGCDIWGANAKRRFFGDKHWHEPVLWDKASKVKGIRHRVFCASMSDIFEPRSELSPWRDKLWELILKTPNLDWLLLTKHPDQIQYFCPWVNNWPDNVWLGTTVENQEYANKRIPHLLQHSAKIRFLSCEPLLGPLDITSWQNGIDWVITGGESGPKARPMHPDWVRKLRDQCQVADIPFHFKQWGHWAPEETLTDIQKRHTVELLGQRMVGLGKKRAGRELDGDEWNGFPYRRIVTC